MKRLARPVAILAASAALISPLTLAGGSPASATAGHPAFSASARCTLSSADRAAILDRLALVRRQLAGTHRPSRVEIRALHAAIAELWVAARNAKMTAAVRVAKRAEVARLIASLRAAGSDTARVAIRAEITAIRAELRAARLTHAERAVLRAQANALRSALLGRPTAVVARALRVERARLIVSLGCRRGAVSVPAVTGI
jgi:hypothetical protein